MPRTTKKTTAPIEKHTIPTVPAAEQPYQVPENWRYYRIENLAIRLKRGKTPKYTQNSEILVFAQKCNQKDGTIIMEKAQFLDPMKALQYSEEEFLQDKDIIINSTGTGTLGRVGLYRTEYALPYNKVLPDSHITVLRLSKLVNQKYMYLYLQLKQDYLEQQGVGSTNQKELKPDSISIIPIPLPPLAEQQRIVDRIERLFAKLDEAREKAQAVVDGFENRKAAILHKAFTGELTKRWREERGIGMESWTSVIMNSVLDVRDGTHDSPKYFDIGYPLVTSKNLKNGMITDKDIKYISKDDYDKINERSKVDKGDILFAMIGTIGNPVVVEDEPVYAIKNVALFKNIGKINPYFVRYYLESKTVIDKMEREAKGSTQKFVSLGYLRNFIISKPSDLEQNKVVQLINHLLTSERHARDLAESVIAQIDGMKKAILARAFRGELGTNEPGEPACEV